MGLLDMAVEPGQRRLLLACIVFAFAENLACPPAARLRRRILGVA
jgi:hypothetical protein